MPTTREVNRGKLISCIADVLKAAPALSFKGFVDLVIGESIPVKDEEVYDIILEWTIENEDKLNQEYDWGVYTLPKVIEIKNTEEEEIVEFCVVCGVWNELDSDWCCPNCDVSELEEDD
tara:strand:+ start:333 stop:689 length:357 start_codon:yes stop_codon:yes gene_type:complete